MSKARIALCLSGGGFRASLFHLGVLRRLHETGLLENVHIISAVSGGAISSALFQTVITGINAEGTGIEYNWEKFQSKLLHATSRGIVHHFYYSLILWIAVIALGPMLLLSTPAAIFVAGLIITLYGYLFRAVMRAEMKVSREKQLWSKVSGKTDDSPYRLYNRMLTPFCASEMRVITLIDEVFEGQIMATLPGWPLLCLSAVDLISGQQKVFTSRVLAELTDVGATAIWNGRGDESTTEGSFLELESSEPSFRAAYDIGFVTCGHAVAATTAIPPIFQPVNFFKPSEHLGTFVDGGVLDNLGLNPIVQLAHSISAARRPRYDSSRGGEYSFKELITHILIADASGRPRRRLRPYFLRTSLASRTVSIMQESQRAESLRKCWLVQALCERPTTMLGIHMGFPAGAQLADERCQRVLPLIRTHLDSFSPQETASLIYAGYMWTHCWVGSQSLVDVSSVPPCASPADMLAGRSMKHLGNEAEMLEAVSGRGLPDKVRRVFRALLPCWAR